MINRCCRVVDNQVNDKFIWIKIWSQILSPGSQKAVTGRGRDRRRGDLRLLQTGSQPLAPGPVRYSHPGGPAGDEISPHAHALVAKYHGKPHDRALPSASFDFYRVCLQDHNILKTLRQARTWASFPCCSTLSPTNWCTWSGSASFWPGSRPPRRKNPRGDRRVHRLDPERSWNRLTI